MLGATKLTVCLRCRKSLLLTNLGKRSIQTSSVLQRQGVKRKSPPPNFRQLIDRPTRHADFLPPRTQRPQHHFHGGSPRASRLNSPDQVRQKLNEGMYRWALLPATIARLGSMGVQKEQAKMLLNTFVDERPRTPYGWFHPEEDDKWQMTRIQDEMVESLPRAVDGALTRRFMAWALETSRTSGRFPPSLYSTLVAMRNAVDFTHPAEWYPVARMVRRKVHMHVGPTNSGKTHNALRALAASGRGVYASPLRLLAYEVFDRLNKGDIVPMDMDASTPREMCKRRCDLLTGEEVRKAGEDSPLLSCTVEMLNCDRRYQVAVIDEIQMLSDPERGGAWTAAVLGLHAEEVHLCGEAGAVPLVQEMLKETGDELIVHRYERLTPLVMATQSLKGDLRKVEKGDCVVAFSRGMLFSLKKEIEKVTGLRCAIIYGRLPPEVRTEQADLFNDADSGYDVLVGSDAIGMGLNLKIKRIVFESSWKYDGNVERTLSFSQLKQIAGRAGRYGLHGTDAGGVVTTLHEEDLPVVRKAVESRAVPVSKRAVLPTRKESFHELEQLIHAETLFSSVFDVLRNTVLMEPHYDLPDLSKGGGRVLSLLDKLCGDYTLDERLKIMYAPVQWRDTSVAMAMERFLRMYRRDSHVKFLDGVTGLKLIESLDKVREMQAADPNSSRSELSTSLSLGGAKDEGNDIPPGVTVSREVAEAVAAIKEKSTPPSADLLLKLESLYRITVVYMWFNMRLPLVFSEREDAVRVKEEVEEMVEWSLERMMHERVKAKSKSRAKEEETGKEEADIEGDKETSRKPLRKKRKKELRVDGLDDAPPGEETVERFNGTLEETDKREEKARDRVH